MLGPVVPRPTDDQLSVGISFLSVLRPHPHLVLGAGLQGICVIRIPEALLVILALLSVLLALALSASVPWGHSSHSSFGVPDLILAILDVVVGDGRASPCPAAHSMSRRGSSQSLSSPSPSARTARTEARPNVSDRDGHFFRGAAARLVVDLHYHQVGACC